MGEYTEFMQEISTNANIDLVIYHDHYATMEQRWFDGGR